MTSIFVAKLDFGVSNEELKTIFEKFGRVLKATIATDKETGKPRGFAFVEMANEEEAQNAIDALDGSQINGREIAVKKADDRGGNTKPAFQNRDNKNAGFQNRAPRPNNNEGGYKGSATSNSPTERPPRRDNTDFVPPAPIPVIENPDKKRNLDPKKDKVRLESKGDLKKAKKMEAYKKSGKENSYFDEDDELDEDFNLFGLDEEDEIEEDDYSKYLVNSDEDEDDFDEEYDEDLDEEDED